jgi:hypothetical protein
MFRALLAHSQETLLKRHLVHCVCVTSVGRTRFEVSESRYALRLRYVELVVSIEVAIEVCCCFTVSSF